MLDLFSTPIKFFKKDVIGKVPKQINDKFKAHFFGGTKTFKVVEFSGDSIFAMLVEE